MCVNALLPTSMLKVFVTKQQHLSLTSHSGGFRIHLRTSVKEFELRNFIFRIIFYAVLLAVCTSLKFDFQLVTLQLAGVLASFQLDYVFITLLQALVKRRYLTQQFFKPLIKYKDLKIDQLLKLSFLHVFRNTCCNIVVREQVLLRSFDNFCVEHTST